MLDADFFSVFTVISAMYAIASGVTLGSTAFVWLTLKNPPLTYLEPKIAALVATGVLWLLGSTFFAGQLTQAIFESDGDLTVPVRILGRFALWLVFSVAVAVSHTFVISFARRKDGTR